MASENRTYTVTGMTCAHCVASVSAVRSAAFTLEVRS